MSTLEIGCLLTVWELREEDRTPLCFTSAGNIHSGGLNCLLAYMSLRVCEKNHHKFLLWGYKDEFANSEGLSSDS